VEACEHISGRCIVSRRSQPENHFDNPETFGMREVVYAGFEQLSSYPNLPGADPDHAR
jgi:hypothetical protein